MNQVSFLPVSTMILHLRTLNMNIFAYIQFFKQGPWKNLQTDLTNIWWKKNCGIFSAWCSSTSSLESVWGVSLLFTTKFPKIPGTHFIDLGKMKGWVDFGANKWFWTKDLWIGNPVPLPLCHYSIKPHKTIHLWYI